MGYAIISPCRNEQDYMRRTLDSVVAQSVRPDLWVIVDDGSTDDTPAILAEYAAAHDWIRVLSKPDRGHRAVGPGVIEAFYFALDRMEIDAYDQICKLDLYNRLCSADGGKPVFPSRLPSIHNRLTAKRRDGHGTFVLPVFRSLSHDELDV